MTPRCADLITALKTPQAMPGFSLQRWDVLIPQARAAGVLGRLGALAAPFSEMLPGPVWHALEAGLTMAERQAVAVQHELAQLDAALADTGVPVVVLKGAAYVAAGIDAGAGRMMSDIDLLVPRAALGEVEAALMLAGWASQSRDAYDQRYYRQWMHEIPPMEHLRRGTVLDVHHNLLPETGRIRTHPAVFIDAATLLPGMRCLRVPTLPDMILHSAAHLMHEGEWGHGLRDLADLHALIPPACTDDFWTELSKRAHLLGLEYPLFLALEQLQQVFARPSPLLNRLPVRHNPLLDALITRAVFSFDPHHRSALTRLAELALYVRSHWLRMPVHLLLPHLLYKACKRPVDD